MPEDVQNKIHETIQRLLTSLGMRTSTYNFDMRIDKDFNVYLMGVAPRDGGNYIPQVIRYATGVDLVECSVEAAMGETIDIPAIDPRIKENNVVENHLIVRSGDEVHTFIGANSILGVLAMRFDSLEQMLGMIENADEWIGIEYQ